MPPPVKRPILQAIAIAIACVVLYGGCLELEQKIVIRRNGTVKVALTYAIDNTFAEIGAVDGNSNNHHISTLPINQQDFEQLDALNHDIALNRYRKRIRSDHYRVNARLTFDTVDAFNRVFMVSTPNAPTPTPSLRIAERGTGGDFTLVFVGMPTAPDTENQTARRFAELDMIRRSSVLYTIRTPQPIQSVVYPPAYPITVVSRIDTESTLPQSVHAVQKNRTLTLYASLSSVLVLPPQSSIRVLW